MKRKRHTEEQIIAILKEHEAGMKTADLCRKHGISEASFYNWKAKYGGLEVSEAKRLKGVESENAKLKKLLVDTMLGTCPGDLSQGFWTTNYVRDWLPIRREQCAKRVSRKSRWSRSSARRIASRCRW
jgi:putative transposase